MKKFLVAIDQGTTSSRAILFSLSGKPILVSNWSGHVDFLKEGAVLLDGELKNVHPSAADQFLLREAKWFSVNISEALTKMKDVFKNYSKYLPGSTKLAKHNKDNFSLQKMTEEFDGILNQYGIYSKVQPKFQQLQLPKLKMLKKGE